jgi:glycosyltransferase involved in cell wall biosynthesis
MVVIFTSNSKGGIYQFSIQIGEVFKTIGHDVVVFCPSEAENNMSNLNFEYYERKKTWNIYDSKIKSIAEKIVALKPEMVIFVDDVITSSEVAMNLPLNIKTGMIIHDVTPHISNNFIKRIKRAVNIHIIEKSYNYVNYIICLSKNSVDKMKKIYPKVKEKVIYFPLGAHLVTTNKLKPEEMDESTQYALFFGRIDTYKGIDVLINEYEKYGNRDIRLVIAGNGRIKAELIEKAHSLNITLINRYINDSEMNWLFSHANVLVLPYIEASQSGIIPIAYYYGKPVVVSNLLGLTENVIEHETGEIFRKPEELMIKLEKVFNFHKEYEESVISYSEKYLNWEKNVVKLYEQIFLEM